MYSSVIELPTEVLNALDADDSETWRIAYNESDPKTEEEVKEARKRAWEACKTLPSSFSFDIVASVEDVDSDGELITIDSLKNQMDMFIKQGGTVQSEHGDYHTAVIWDWDEYTDPDTGYPGVLVHGNVFGGRDENTEYKKAREDFINGRNSLSIAGDASVEGYECDGQRCFVRRNLTQLMEISLVENPANPYATLKWYNDKAVAKGNRNFKVKTVGIHKSYNECDLEGIRKALRGRYECEITAKGIKVSSIDIMALNRLVKGIGQVVDSKDDYTIIDSNKRILEREFKKSYSDDECDYKGMLTNVSEQRFKELFQKDMIHKSEKGWGFNADILKAKKYTDQNSPEFEELYQICNRAGEYVHRINNTAYFTYTREDLDALSPLFGSGHHAGSINEYEIEDTSNMKSEVGQKYDLEMKKQLKRINDIDNKLYDDILKALDKWKESLNSPAEKLNALNEKLQDMIWE